MAPQSDPNDFSGKYNTPIPPEKQAAFRQYVADQTQKTGKSPLHDRYDYDVQGDWLAGAQKDYRGHGSDQFKKPNHPTFSDESQYHGRDGFSGGSWIPDAPGGKSFFQPSDTNLQFSRGMGGLQQYFADPRNQDTNITPIPPLDVHPPAVPGLTSPAPYRVRK